MLIAFIKENIVVEVASVSEDEYSERATPFQAAIDVSDLTPTPQVGWAWDGLNFSNNGVSSVPSKKISKLGFRNRFTSVEKVALRTAINGSVQIQALYDDFIAAEYIDLARADTIYGVNVLASPGVAIISAERANEILNNPIQPSEQWRPDDA